MENTYYDDRVVYASKNSGKSRNDHHMPSASLKTKKKKNSKATETEEQNEQQIQTEKNISRSSSIGFGESYERMDVNANDYEMCSSDDDEGKKEVEQFFPSSASEEEQNDEDLMLPMIPMVFACDDSNNNINNINNNINNINNRYNEFTGSTIKALLDHHDTLNRKITLHDTELAEDMLLDQLSAETKQFVLNAREAKHLSHRKDIIEYVLECCSIANYNAITADVCINYIDKVLSSLEIPKSSIQLVALCCLHLAVKYEEIEDVVMSTSALRNAFGPNYSKEIILKMEVALLKEMNWKMSCVTTSHFIESILKVCDGATHESDDDGEDIDKLTNLSFEMYKGILADAEIRSSVLPSVIATACISAARTKLSLKPALTQELKIASNLSESNLAQINNWLIGHCLCVYNSSSLANDQHQLTNDMDDIECNERQDQEGNMKSSKEDFLTAEEEFKRHEDVYSPTGVIESSSMFLGDD